MRKKLSRTKIAFCILTFVGVLVALIKVALPSEVLFESLESKTNEDGAIFNRVKLISEAERDIWMMAQSHDGKNSHNWDRLAIVVNKKTQSVRFYQLEPGPLEWREPVQEIGFRVSCYMCHSNGPRALRPNWNSFQLKSSLAEKASVALWNLRIKSYGRLRAEDHADQKRKVPFARSGPIADEPLKVATCVRCHAEKGFFARGQLTRQHFMPIRFLVENGHMPPPGFRLSPEERAELEAFVGKKQ